MEWLKEPNYFDFVQQPMREKRSQTEYIIREAVATFRKPVMLWAGGKDSTVMLWVAKQLFREVPFPVVLLDTSFQFPETYRFMEKTAKDWKIDFIRYRNKEALEEGVSPFTNSRFECCQKLKTEALAKLIEEKGFDAVLVGIRWDEHGIRGKEKAFSRRAEPEHMRIHPMLHWSLDEVWKFTRENNIPYNPLYDKIEAGGKTFKSIGCRPCTKATEKDAAERSGRDLDKEQLMEKLRALGYM